MAAWLGKHLNIAADVSSGLSQDISGANVTRVMPRGVQRVAAVAPGQAMGFIHVCHITRANQHCRGALRSSLIWDAAASLNGRPKRHHGQQIMDMRSYVSASHLMTRWRAGGNSSFHSRFFSHEMRIFRSAAAFCRVGRILPVLS